MSHNPATTDRQEAHEYSGFHGEDRCLTFVVTSDGADSNVCGQPRDAAIHRTHKHHVFRPHSSALHHLCGTLAGGKACMKLAADEIHSAIHRAEMSAEPSPKALTLEEYQAEYLRLCNWRELWLKLANKMETGRLASRQEAVERRASIANNQIKLLMQSYDAQAAQPASDTPATAETARDPQTALNDAVMYALKVGCFFPVPEPQPGASTEELIKWGAMRHLHDAIARFNRGEAVVATPSRCLITCAAFPLNDCKKAHQCIKNTGHRFDPMDGVIHEFESHLIPARREFYQP